MDRKLSNIYYSCAGFWKGHAAIKKLARAAKVSEEVTGSWLKKQAIWQIYWPPRGYTPRSMFDEDRLNAAELLCVFWLVSP